jgi:hypothetical protein
MADPAKLLEVLRTATAGLADVTEKAMFGCGAFFAKGRMFALVWRSGRSGRIGLKLPEAARYDALASQAGAAPWKPNDRAMGSWLLVPPTLEDAEVLVPWLEEAHAMAAAALAKKPAAKKPAAKKPVAKRTP